MGKGKRVAFYLRVSTGGQTVENQRLELAAAAAQRGWTVVELYSDNGFSGAKGRDKRPAFDRMCKDAIAGKFDIILTDINMPIMDGLKLVKRVRTDPTHKDVPIIVITTEGSSEDRQRALQLGANAYITKPIQAPQVIAKVKELLKIDA